MAAQETTATISRLSEMSQSLVSAGWLCFGFGKWAMDHLYLVESRGFYFFKSW